MSSLNKVFIHIAVHIYYISSVLSFVFLIFSIYDNNFGTDSDSLPRTAAFSSHAKTPTGSSLSVRTALREILNFTALNFRVLD